MHYALCTALWRQDPVPWDVEQLSLPPAVANLGFYPLSTFAIFKVY
jgi:hypothetical protein